MSAEPTGPHIEDPEHTANSAGTDANGSHDIGSFIRQQRERSAISLRKLADTAGISNPYLSQIERGLRKPSAEILKAIARGLSISAETMYSRAGLLDEWGDRPTVVEAIEHDPALDARQRQALLDVYRTFVGSHGSTADESATTNQDDQNSTEESS